MAREPIYLTQRGLERIKEELRYLSEEKRQELAEYMGAALADGDLRENAAYDEARLLQSANETRIADLEAILDRAVVVEQEEGAEAVAQLGASLELEDGGGSRVTFHLVGTHEADILENRISDESPLGQELMGKRAGDEVALTLGGGTVTYTVVEVRFE
ncbi:MAG: transcription elongation factor GreA [Trueperaceae bacterium]|nr:MAG: transcription elongation factor GreA [Trueperaceae bacterium]